MLSYNLTQDAVMSPQQQDPMMLNYYRRPEQVIAQLQHALSQRDQEISYYKAQAQQQPENVLDEFDDDECFDDEDDIGGAGGIPGSTGAAAGINELDLDGDELYYPGKHNQSRSAQYPMMVINSASTEMTPFKLGNNMSL